MAKDGESPMSDTQRGVAANSPERIRNAYNMFKGGCENIPQSREMLDTVETARTTGVEHPDGGTIYDAVHAFLKPGHTELPEIVQMVADKHGLVEVDRKHRYDSEEIERAAFVRVEEV